MSFPRLLFAVLLVATWTLTDAFSTPTPITRQQSLVLLKAQPDKEETVPVGSEEYYKGFLSRTLEEEPVERVTGDAILGPTFKFVGGFAAALV